MTLRELHDFLPAWFLPVASFAFGLLWGSFLNVVIYRVPREMSVVRPASHCPGCGKPIAAYDNIPVLSYVILRGRARCCGAKMSPRYPLVELLGGGLSLAIWYANVATLPPGESVGRAAAIYGADFALALGLLAAAFIDAEHMFLPDSITLGGIVVGVATASLRDMRVTESLLGVAVGFVGVWFPLSFLYKGFRGRTGMGVGDAKLVALAGAWFGWPGAVFALFAGAIQGTVYAVVLRVLGVRPKLPAAVLEDIAALEKAAAEGDEDAKKELADDPLTEEWDPFILRWIYVKILKRPWPPPWAEEEEEEEEEEAEAGEGEGATESATSRAEEAPPRIPFGPFLILACLELLYFRDVIADRLAILFQPW